MEMASKEPAEAVGEFLFELLKVIFSLTFPIMVISLCAVSFVLMTILGTPELGLWAALGVAAIEAARANGWVALALVVLVFAALPLAWVGFREREIRISKAILEWVLTALIFAFIFWLRHVWPFSRNGWQLLIFAFLIFTAWNGVIEAAMSTLVVIAQVRRNRPRPIAPPHQQPHGTRQSHAPRDEPETI
jgi:hypothetical protein